MIKYFFSECYTYNILNESDRGIANGVSKYNCDKDGFKASNGGTSPMWKGPSWYRYDIKKESEHCEINILYLPVGHS